MFKKVFCVLLVAVLIFSAVITAGSAYTPPNFDIEAEGAMLVNTDTGDIIYSKNRTKYFCLTYIFII